MHGFPLPCLPWLLLPSSRARRHKSCHRTMMGHEEARKLSQHPSREGDMIKHALAVAAVSAFALAAPTQVRAQAAFPPPPPKVSPAAGVIDMHVHSHPDVFGRNMDDIDVAQLAK